MPEDINKSVRFIAKLLELTQDGRLDWKRDAESAFLARLEDKMLKIYEVRRRVVSDSTKKAGINWVVSPSYKTAIVLELLNDDGSTAFKFENVAGMKDLLQAVAFSASKVNEFIDKILSK